MTRYSKCPCPLSVWQWLLRPEYLDACAEAEAFLPVEDYEWGIRGEKQDGTQALMCQKWRQAGGQPLKGWKVIQNFKDTDEQRSGVLK